MIYNIKKIMVRYITSYFTFIKENKVEFQNTIELYDLFAYSIDEMFNLNPTSTSLFVHKYYNDCIEFLQTTKGVPKNPEKLSLSERVDITNMCKSYFVGADYLSKQKVERALE